MSTWKISKYLSEKGFDVAIFSFSSNGHRQQEFAQLFVANEHGRQSNRQNLRQLDRTLLSFRPHVVVNQMPYERNIGNVLRGHSTSVLIGCLRNTLHSVTIDMDAYMRRKWPRAPDFFVRNRAIQTMMRRIHKSRHGSQLRWILATYDRFIMFGPPNLSELQHFVNNYDKTKVGLIPNSIPSIAETVPIKEKRILWLGRVAIEQKRADLIVPLWIEIKDVLPDWRFDVVGDGPALADLQRKVDLEKIERITFHGRQTPDDFFERASIFVMTSTYEGFPNVLVEAQSFGAIPVLFNSFRIAEWMVHDGVDAFLAPPFSVDTLAERVISIAQSPDIEELMSNSLSNARRFSIETVGPMWEQLFEDCLSNC